MVIEYAFLNSPISPVSFNGPFIYSAERVMIGGVRDEEYALMLKIIRFPAFLSSNSRDPSSFFSVKFIRNSLLFLLRF